MADVQLEAVVSIDIDGSLKKIKTDVKRLSKEVEGLLSDIKIKVGTIDPSSLSKLNQDVKQASQTATKNAVIKPTVDIDLSKERAKFNQIQKTARDT